MASTSSQTAMNAPEIELGELGSSPEASRREEEAVALHPVDGGFHAWLFVFCAFVLECLVWGFPFSYGIFQDWYLTHEFSGSSEASINSVGTVTLALQYSEGLFCIYFAKRYARHLRPLMAGSLLVCVASMFVSSFATKVWQLILLQGVIYGIAGGFLYAPVILWLSEWFVTRRSLAGSLIFGGSGLGGAVFPLLLTGLLERLGFRWTLRIWSGLMLLFGGLAVMGTKPRLPVAPTSNSSHSHERAFDLSFLSTPLFISVAVTIFIQGLAYFCVSLYIPSYATSMGYSRLQGTLALSTFNIASVVGQVAFGYYCDYKPFTGVMVFSGILSSVLAYALWGFAHELTSVFVFVVSFGSISGGFSSIWPPASSTVAVSQPSTVFMCFAIVKGLSAITGPLIAAALHPKPLMTGAYKASRGGWGGYGFTGITIFVGSAMAATAAMSVVSSLVRKRFVIQRAATNP